MIHFARRAAIAVACGLPLLCSAHSQSGGAGSCRQGVLALIVMIEAEEQEKSHYRNTAASVVGTCGPPATQPASNQARFDKAACGKLALAMLENIDDSNMGNPQFVVARDEFAGRCLAK